MVPAASMIFPLTAPVLSPMRWRSATPTRKVRRGAPVIEQRDAQDEIRHCVRRYEIPRPVVPAARVPIVLRVDPVLPVIEEEIRVQARGIVNRIPWHGNEFGILLNIQVATSVGAPGFKA